MIKEIESHHVMERIMERGQIHPYGFPIVNVSKIREGSRTSTHILQTCKEDGSTFKRNHRGAQEVLNIMRN